MKKRFLGLCLASVLLAGGLASCSGSNQTGTGYFYNPNALMKTGESGTKVPTTDSNTLVTVRAEVTANGGKAASVSFDAVEMPLLWSQLKEAKDGVTTTLTFGSNTYYPANYISVGGMVFQLEFDELSGSTEDNLTGYGYFALDTTKFAGEDRSLESYIGRSSDTGKWYYDLMKEGDFKVLTSKDGTEADASLLKSSHHFLKDDGYDGIVDKKIWKSNTDALANFFVTAFPVIYPVSGADEAKKAILAQSGSDYTVHVEWTRTVDGTSTVYTDFDNTVLTGVKFESLDVLRSYYRAANAAFASVERSSYSLF